MPQPPPSPSRGGSQSGGAADPLRGDGEEIEDEADGGDRIGVKLVLREDESDVEGGWDTGSAVSQKCCS